jgi:hypothetical protein
MSAILTLDPIICHVRAVTKSAFSSAKIIGLIVASTDHRSGDDIRLWHCLDLPLMFSDVCSLVAGSLSISRRRPSYQLGCATLQFGIRQPHLNCRKRNVPFGKNWHNISTAV